jgi:adenylate cyclase
MDSEQLPRKLAAILYADVAGYSRLTGEDEDATHRTLSEYLDQIAATIELQGGHVMHYAGDAVLAMFDAVTDALACAARIQDDLKTRNDNFPDERKVQFRIGVNLGDVIEDRGDIYGDGVNVAARLESLAEPGGICISESVHTAVGNKLPLHYEFMGEQEVKNIAKPVRAYSARLEPGAMLPRPSARKRARRSMHHVITAAAALVVVIGVGMIAWLQPWQTREESSPAESMTSPSPDKPSIAVLPFSNMSDDKEQEYFSDGLSEDLITDLSRVSGLRVIARQSSFAYKGEVVDVQEIGRDLKARYVLEGSVRRSADRVRINVQLIDTKEGTNIWANRYDHTLKDMFELQDEVTQTIVSALAVSLTLEEERFLDRTRTVNPDAYDLLLRGLEPLHRFTGEDNAVARSFFQQAISLDPDYARAHANLALTYARDVVFAWTEQREESIRFALESADRAEALDDALTQTHFARSVVYLAQRKHEESAASSRKAIELDPNYADGYGMLAQTLVQAGVLEEALAAIGKAKVLNPRYPFAYLGIEGHIYFLMAQYEKAIPILQEALERNPAFVAARLNLIASYGQLGMVDDAEWELDELLVVRPNYGIAVAREEVLYRRPEDTERFITGLSKAGLE